MAFTRATIRNLAKDSGVELPKELEDALVTEHINARDAYAEEQVKAEREKQPDKPNSNVKDSEEYKTLKKAYDDYKAEIAAKETRAAKETAYRDILKDASLSDKGIEKAVKYAIWDSMELDADGKLKDATSHISAAKEEWSDYVTTTTTKGADTATPPDNSGGGTKMTRADIYQKDENGRYVLSTAERQKALADNPQLLH